MTSGKFVARILIVDDEPAVCEMLEDRLRNEGYDCATGSSAEEALALIKKEAFDLILSDLRLPGLSGMDLLEKAREECPGAAFILITAEHDIQTGIAAMKQGAADYVTKPFEIASVVRSVAYGLERKRLERELENYRASLEAMVEKRTGELQTAIRRVEETCDATLETLGAALDLRDSATEGHSARVTCYARMIAEALGCTAGQLREITRGAYLHDIGKMGVPDGILLKQGKLTPEEQGVMESHVMTGYQLVRRIPFLAEAARIVLTHQERYDGLGYPAGLKGADIPIGARVFAVADTLDAMTSDRPYRKAMPFSVALAEIRKESGRQFDPAIVQVFLGIPESRWIEARAAAVLEPPRRFILPSSEYSISPPTA